MFNFGKGRHLIVADSFCNFDYIKNVDLVLGTENSGKCEPVPLIATFKTLMPLG